MMKTLAKALDIRKRKAFHVEPATDYNGARVFVVRRCYGTVTRTTRTRKSRERKFNLFSTDISLMPFAALVKL